MPNFLTSVTPLKSPLNFVLTINNIFVAESKEDHIKDSLHEREHEHEHEHEHEQETGKGSKKVSVDDIRHGWLVVSHCSTHAFRIGSLSISCLNFFKCPKTH